MYKFISISVDSEYVHKAWRCVKIEDGGIGNDIKYVMVSDINKIISSSYNTLSSLGVSFRSSVFIDKKKILLYNIPMIFQ